MVDAAALPAPGGLRTQILPLAALVAMLVQGCGGGGSGSHSPAGPAAVTVIPGRLVTLLEDESHAGSLTFPGASEGAVYQVAAAPDHGTLELDRDGGFTYTPAADFHGADSFTFQVAQPDGASFSGLVHLDVLPANDPPVLAPIPDQANGSEVRDVLVPLLITDVDGDAVTIDASTGDAGIAEVEVDPGARQLRIRGRSYGTATISVRVSDGIDAASQRFAFTVADRQRRLMIGVDRPASSAIALTNAGPGTVDIELTHNGRHAFASLDQVVEAVRAQPDEISDEPFERKLWRFLRDNTLHYPPVGGAGWLDGTWPTLNSFGWGFCSNVTSAFIQIATAAGYEARAWTLAGHVLPEVRIDDAWHAYDPDVAVYYRRRDGAVASVTDLALDTTLITTPESPILNAGSDAYRAAYDPLLAQIYGSTADNVLATWYPSREPFAGSRISLPAGARLVYPARWTPDPTGYDGATPYPVEFARQARLELPPGVVGRIRVPWVLWDIQGAGDVQVGTEVYAAGSASLAGKLASAEVPVTEIDILGNTAGMALVMMINPVWYEVLPANEVVVTGRETWAIVPGVLDLEAANRVRPVPAGVRRPAN